MHIYWLPERLDGITQYLVFFFMANHSPNISFAYLSPILIYFHMKNLSCEYY